MRGKTKNLGRDDVIGLKKTTRTHDKCVPLPRRHAQKAASCTDNMHNAMLPVTDGQKETEPPSQEVITPPPPRVLPVARGLTHHPLWGHRY